MPSPRKALQTTPATNALVAIVLAMSPLNLARAEIIPNLPDALVCSVKDPTGTLQWEKLVYYVSASMIDGRTLYKTLTSDPVVLLVSPDGVIEGANLADCDGRTIESLRAEGRAFSLTAPSPKKTNGS